MSAANKILQAAAGNAAGDRIYVDDVFSTFLYGAEGTNPTIQTGIDMSEDGGMVWIKNRDAAEHNSIIDTERSADGSLASWVATSDTSAQSSGYSTGISATFPTNGFTVSGTRDNLYNNSADFVSWNFKRAEGFFDVVTFEAPSSPDTNYRISHNLGSAPGTILLKNVDKAYQWWVFHRSEGRNKYLVLNNTNASASSTGIWGTADPTSTDFGVNANNTGPRSVDVGSGTYIAYLFAHDDQSFGDDGDESIIKCGSYSGNGLTTGNEITLGFEPQWLMVKRIDSANDWMMMDIMRGISFSANNYLLANTSGAEQATGSVVVPTATGFNILTDTSSLNNSSGTYIYIAIRRPMKTPESGTEVFKAVSRSGNSTAGTSITCGFPLDWVVTQGRSAAIEPISYTRLQGSGKKLFTYNTSAEGSSGTNVITSFDQDGMTVGTDTDINNSSYTYINWFFKRATGFFDVVTYTGNGTAGRTVSHNLGSVPGLMIIKNTAFAEEWTVYHRSEGATKALRLDSTQASSTSSSRFNNTEPTATEFTVGAFESVNRSGDTIVAYLFATLDGVSKVGSYTGTGSNVDVNCGFSSTARFVLIKRTDSTGDWYVYDHARGIVAGNDPFQEWNNAAAETGSTDYIDPLSTGFTITSSAPADLNTSGGTYIFLAIA